MTNSLIFCPDADFPGEGDSREFNLQARNLKNAHGGTIVNFDNETSDMNARASTVLNALRSQPSGSVDWLATVCHGWGRGIQPGFDLRGGIKGVKPVVLAAEIARIAKPNVQFILPLYSCSTAEDPINGFAAVLSTELAKNGVNSVLFGHTEVAHCTRCPFVKRFESGKSEWVVDPNGPLWSKWVTKMHDLRGNLPLRFPFMTKEALVAEIKA